MKVYVHTRSEQIIVIDNETAILESKVANHTINDQLENAAIRLETGARGLFIFDQHLTDLINPEPPNPSQKPENEPQENPHNPQPPTPQTTIT